MSIWKVASATVVTLFVAACGSSGVSKKPMTATPERKGAAKGTVEAGLKLNKLKTNSKDTDAINAFSEIYADASQLTGSVQADAVSGKLVSALSDNIDQCVTESGGTVTYNQCDFNGTKVNGTVKIQGDVISIDLTIEASGGISGGVSSVNLHYVGSVTVSDTKIDGSLDVTTDVGTTEYGTVSANTSVDFNAIVVTSGCATGGSMDVNSVTSAAGHSYTTAVTVTFGPNCGDMTMTGGTDLPGMGG